ncbi:MAG: ABC transporter permease [Planctomycetota bacterium]
MGQRIGGLIKILGITLLLVSLWGFLVSVSPLSFLTPNNLENLLRRTALYGVLGVGVAFVIISSGIDLSIGSLVCLSACLLALFLEVSYEPMGQTEVFGANKNESTLTIASDHSFEIGDQIWFYKDRRNKGLFKILEFGEASEVGGQKQVQVKVDPAPKRDVQLEQNEKGGTVSNTFEVESLDGTNATLNSSFPALRQKDRILMVHPKSSSREKVIVSSTDSSNYVFKNKDAKLDSSFRAVPIVRKPLMSIPVALLAVLGIVLLLGVIHGLLITKVKIRPFVVTLCGLLIYRGLSRALTNDQTVGFIEYSDSLGKLGTGRLETGIEFMPVKVAPVDAESAESWKMAWDAAEGAQAFGIPYSFFIFLFVTVAAMIFLNLTVWGRHLQAVGRNEEAARYSGINTSRITILAYVLCAVLTGLGGIMFAIDSNSIAPSSFGNFFELYAIAAAVLGGCSLRGGEGSILGVVVGTALMQTLYNSIVLLKIPDELEFTIIGAVILFGVAADELTRMLAARFRSKES